MFFQLFSIFIFFGFLELKFYIIKNKALKTKWEMNVTDLLETFEFRKNSSKKISYLAYEMHMLFCEIKAVLFM